MAAAVLAAAGPFAPDGEMSVSAEVSESTVERPLAFPGADGAGKYSTGGRGGEIYHVTNLNDSGAGSFRDAVSKSGRIVVFDVGGTINLKSDVVVKSNISIMGQTAPGGAGITLRNGKIGMGGSNIIVRYISSRPGERGEGSGDYDAWGGSNGSNSIIDHCSLGWANDEQFGLYSGCNNLTVQYTIIGPSNCVSYHSKGAHGFGAMFGEGYNSWHHNLLCHSLSRNFRGKVIGTNPMDFVNNVIYNWGRQTAYGTFGRENYVGNYLKAGPSTKGSYRYIELSSGTGYENYKFYLTGNKVTDKNDKVRSGVTDNNWNGFSFNSNTTYLEAYYRSSRHFPIMNGEDDVSVAPHAETADEAYANVLAYAGAGIDAASRPKIDAQVIEETRTGTGSLTGGRDFSTVTDSDVKSAISTYGIEYVDYDSYYPEATSKTITDSDNDGMPDEWEVDRGLNPNDPSDANGHYIGGYYTNIEHYCNDLTVNSFPEGTVTLSPTLSELGSGYRAAIADYEALSLNKSKISSASELKLSEIGENGSNITWTSLSSDLIIENNQPVSVTRPKNNDKKIVLAAEISNQGFTATKYFDLTIRTTTLKWFASSANDGAAAGTELMKNLTALFDIKTGSLSSSFNIDGKNYTDCISSSQNGSYSGGAGQGTCLRFTAPADGTLYAYAGDVGNSTNAKTFYIVKEGADSAESGKIASKQGNGSNLTLSASVEKGVVYYIFVAGSKGKLVGVKFDEDQESLPEATPVSYTEKWSFDNIEAGGSFDNNAEIPNGSGLSLKSVYKSGSGTMPTVKQRSGSNNYLELTYAEGGQDGFIYTPSEPMDGDKLIFEMDFSKSDQEKDTVLFRVFDTVHASPDNTYTTSTDGRVFELKTSINQDLVVTDMFSRGTASTDSSPKGVDFGISGFAQEKDAWYRVKLEYYKNADGIPTIDVYTGTGGGGYTYRDTVYLGSGTTKLDPRDITITPTKVQCLTRKENNVTLGIDNVSFTVQKAGEPVEEVPEGVEYRFEQNGAEVTEFNSSELTCAISGSALSGMFTAEAAEYNSDGALVTVHEEILDTSGEIRFTPSDQTAEIKVFILSNTDKLEPLWKEAQIQRAGS